MKSCNAPIVKVTVAEDRAYVSRSLVVDLEAGVHQLKIAPVAPILVDKTLVLRAGDASVLDYRVVREIEDKPEEEQHRERLSQQLKEVAEEQQRLVDRRVELRGFAAQLLQEISDEAAWGRGEREQWQRLLGDLRKKESLVDDRLAELDKEQKDVKNRLQDVQPGDIILRASLEFTLEVSQATEVNLQVRYAVPCASWRPNHQAIALGDSLTFQAGACVWQKTGEDWSDVELSFSTERTAQTTSLPELSSDILTVRPRQEDLFLEVREEEVERLQRPSVEKVKSVPGIDDGGEVFAITASHRATVPSDGQPYKVNLFEFNSEIEFSNESFPELLEQVQICSKQTNSSEHPLLPGPVDLVRDGKLLGTSWLKFVASNSPFELSWGPNPEVHVRRTYESKEEKEKLLKGWVKTERKVHVFLSNQCGHELTVRVTERIPVSESDDLKVKLNRTYTHLGVTADQDGFVHWEIRLAPRQKLKVPLSYILERRKRAVVS